MAESQNKGKNIVIVVGNSTKRDGANDDVAKVKKTFEDLYNAEVHVMMDKSEDDYNTFFSQLKTDGKWLDKFSQCEFVAVVCLFHGTTDGRIDCNSKILLLKINFLHPFFCIEQLNGKLKWLIVEACRGNLKGPEIQMDGKGGTKYLDYHMVSYCTSEGATIYQYDDHGKIFIQYVCEELTDNATKHNYEKSLVAMMNSVNDKIKQYGEAEDTTRKFPRSEYFKNFEDYFFKSAI